MFKKKIIKSKCKNKSLLHLFTKSKGKDFQVFTLYVIQTLFYIYWSGIPVALKRDQEGQKDSLSISEKHPTSCPTELLALTVMNKQTASQHIFTTFPPNPAKKQQLINSIHHGRSLFFSHYYHHLISSNGDITCSCIYKRLKWGHLEVHTGERIQGNTVKNKTYSAPHYLH